MEDLWNRSGDHRFGYRTPDEEAQEMIEAELEPFLEQVRRYRKLGMLPQAEMYCMGVLQGLYRFDQESETQFREWAEGVAFYCFESLLDEWRKGCESAADQSEMNAFIREACPEWASDVLKDES